MNRVQNRWLMSAAIAAVMALSVFGSMDALSDRYVDGAFNRSLIGFAIARGLNGVISVAQGTGFAVTPAGVGVSFSPGEILDPINDLVERFSWIMLLSSSALGVQKVLLSMSAWQGLIIAILVAGSILIAMQWVRRHNLGWIRNQLMRVFMLLLILRFMMPIISLANEWVYRTFLQEQYLTSSAELEVASSEIGDINDEVLNRQETAPSGLVDRAKALYQSAIRQIDFEQRLNDYKSAAETISENTIKLIVVFLMQTVVFPLLFLWVVYTVMKKVIL